ncbi:hypothetical protein O4J55_20140 [Paracoccus sp. PXZ]
MSATVDQKRRFMAVVRSGQHMFAEIAKLSGLTMHEVLEVWAEGVAAKRLRIADDVPGFRFVEEVAP